MDVFWGDFWDTLFYFHLFVILGVIYYIYHECKNFNANFIQAIYSKLKFPILTKQHLDCLNWRNSYFEVERNLYNIKPIVNLLGKHEVGEVTKIIEKDQYGLTSFEREYMKLMKCEGQLKKIHLKKIPKTEADNDPYVEVKFKIDALPIYGYVDEFSLKKEELVTVICSSFSDRLGHYFWLMTNRKDVVYLDEAQPFNNKVDLYVYIFIALFFLVLIAIVAFFVALDSDNFWGDLVVTFLTGFFSLLLIYCIFILYQKIFTETKNINEYILKQLDDLIILPKLSSISDIKPFVMFNKSRKSNSGTGYALDLKKGK